MRVITAFIILLLLMPFALAEITINLDNVKYNLGDRLSPTLEITEDQDLEGFLRISILCDNIAFDYYVAPVSLKTNKKKEIDIPDLALFEDLIGNCYLETILKYPKDTTLSEAKSDLFLVSNALNIFLEDSSFIAYPGEKIIIKGSVKNILNENIGKAKVTLILDDYTLPFEIRKGIIDYNLEIPSDIKSHSNFMDIIAEDSFGNKGKEVIELNIIPAATKIQTKLNKNQFKPYENLEINIQLLDQANELMQGTINFEIINPEKGKIFMKSIESSSTFSYEFDKHAMPGKYILRSFFDDILTQDEILVEEYENLDINIKDGIVYIENTGNIDYKKKVKIILEDEKNDYIIVKSINLEPGFSSMIDLSKEVPEGNYKVKLPEETVENVEIEDNLGFLKKVGYSTSKITGNIVGLSEKSIMKPSMASLIMLLLILAIIITANLDRIKRLIGR